MKIILGSKSPRRREILEMAGIPFICVPSDTDEDIEICEPNEYAKLTALKKSLVLKKTYNNDIIVTCDTIVYIHGQILGKPKDKDDCYKMIKMLSGNSHDVITGVVITYKDYIDNFSVKTKVFVDEMTEEEIQEYINTPEPYDKAGGYAIQGLFAKYIKSIEGDYYNVMGLPLNEVYNALKKINNFKKE